jgi:alcohol dehydrogenase (cytochrome c)
MRGALIALLCVAGCAQKQPSAPVEWPTYNNGLHGQRYSSLAQVSAANLGRLGEVCRVKIDGPGSFHAGFIVQGDTLYTATSRETVAVDATNCTLRWKYDYQPEGERCGGSSRGVSVQDGRVFRGTCDGRMIALSAADGRLLWKSVIASPAAGESTTASPLVWQGMVFMGIGGSELGARGRVVAMDAATGRELWRFNTIPMGSETGADTWKKPETAKTGGGGVWGVMSLDAATGELFVPVGNPWPDIDKGHRPGDNLFTNSVVVLDARSGALKWWHQVSPGDWMDLDLVAAPVLYRAGGRDMVAIAGKDGHVTALDRATKQRVFRTPVTTVETIPADPPPQGARMCPGYAGGVEWNGPALDARNNQLIVGSVDICFNVKLAPPKAYKQGSVEFGGSVEPVGPTTGWITALDPATGAVRWKYHADKPVVAGVTPTAGGVTFAGDLGGNLLVFDSASGKLLRKLDAGGAMAGGLVTYSIADRQYVAFGAGNVSRNAFGDLGFPSVVIMALDPKQPAAQLDATTSTTSGSEAGLGQRLYGQVCQSCHGPDGNLIVDHKLGNLAARRDLPSTIEYIKHPKAPMPALYPQLLDEKSVVAVATWVHQELR